MYLTSRNLPTRILTNIGVFVEDPIMSTSKKKKIRDFGTITVKCCRCLNKNACGI